MSEYKRILVVVRMIQSCRKAIQYGVSLARKFDAELYVIHSVYNPIGLKGWGLGTRQLALEYEKSLVVSRQKLLALIEDEKTQGMTIKELIREGAPTEEILKTIEEEKIDLLVMLAHEEGHVEHLFFGRSNEELVRKMPCSIMLVKKEPEAMAEGKEEE
ncbi:MAG: universal stress protein [Thermodesulfobacteriota bacterium]